MEQCYIKRDDIITIASHRREKKNHSKICWNIVRRLFVSFSVIILFFLVRLCDIFLWKFNLPYREDEKRERKWRKFFFSSFFSDFNVLILYFHVSHIYLLTGNISVLHGIYWVRINVKIKWLSDDFIILLRW